MNPFCETSLELRYVLLTIERWAARWEVLVCLLISMVILWVASKTALNIVRALCLLKGDK